MCVVRWIQIQSDPSVLRLFTGVEGLSLVQPFLLIVINHYWNYSPALHKVVIFSVCSPKACFIPCFDFLSSNTKEKIIINILRIWLMLQTEIFILSLGLVLQWHANIKRLIYAPLRRTIDPYILNGANVTALPLEWTLSNRFVTGSFFFKKEEEGEEQQTWQWWKRYRYILLMYLSDRKIWGSFAAVVLQGR